MTGGQIDQYWRNNLIDIVPYKAGEQNHAPGTIKLNTNENPFPPSATVAAAVQGFSADCLPRYPDPEVSALTEAMARSAGIPRECVFAGNGSDEVLALAFRAFFNSQMPILFPDITYSFYPVWCRLFKIPFTEIPLDADFSIRAQDYSCENGGIVIANPNAPTGIAEGKDFVGELLESNPDSVVIIDEAYVGFGASSVVSLIEKYDNLFISSTFSKSRSLAGLRLGFGFGSGELISAINAVKNSFNSYTISGIQSAAGVAAIDSEEYYQECADALVTIRDAFVGRLEEMGFSFPVSSANFLFVTHARVDAEKLYLWLRRRNILVRWFDRPRIRNHLRITIGTKREMDALLSAIGEYMRDVSD